MTHAEQPRSPSRLVGDQLRSQRGDEMIWFILGAALGVAKRVWSLVRHPMHIERPLQEFVIAAVFGALVPGTILWLIFTFVLPW